MQRGLEGHLIGIPHEARLKCGLVQNPACGIVRALQRRELLQRVACNLRHTSTPLPLCSKLNRSKPMEGRADADNNSRVPELGLAIIPLISYHKILAQILATEQRHASHGRDPCGKECVVNEVLSDPVHKCCAAITTPAVRSTPSTLELNLPCQVAGPDDLPEADRPSVTQLTRPITKLVPRIRVGIRSRPQRQPATGENLPHHRRIADGRVQPQRLCNLKAKPRNTDVHGPHRGRVGPGQGGVVHLPDISPRFVVDWQVAQSRIHEDEPKVHWPRSEFPALLLVAWCADAITITLRSVVTILVLSTIALILACQSVAAWRACSVDLPDTYYGG
mmetsp:Transcript_19739/g.50039  ORF Transcript_19739/g.50039 Transcript_19739/m.50039 type:complete len:334 (+) Transcript_19739:1150-2151(+)